MSQTNTPDTPHTASLIEAICNRRMLICLFIGFTSGLPLYVLISLVPAWLSTEGVSLREIGLFSLILMPYSWKFIWAPAVDRFSMPFLGLRRGWMLLTQVALLGSIACMGFFQPKSAIWGIAYLSFAVALFGATQDIVIDAYRREILSDNELGLGNSLHVNAYRISSLIPGSLALILADHIPWHQVFVITALFMLVGIGLTLTIKEPDISDRPKNIREAVIDPFNEFIHRKGWVEALLILSFIFFYKLGDNMATTLSTPFYLDLGFSLSEIGSVAKIAGLWSSIVGGILGGLLMLKIGINKALWLFGIVQMITILGFAALAEIGSNIWVLGTVISMEYLGVGLGTAAFVAFIARTTHIKYTATQFALFTGLAASPRTMISSSVGYIVESTGWTHFFLLCTLLALPGMALLWFVAPWNERKEP